MSQRWAGPMRGRLILGGVIAVLALNLNSKGTVSAHRRRVAARRRPAADSRVARRWPSTAGRFPRVSDRRRGREKPDADRRGLAAAGPDGRMA